MTDAFIIFLKQMYFMFIPLPGCLYHVIHLRVEPGTGKLTLDVRLSDIGIGEKHVFCTHTIHARGAVALDSRTTEDSHESLKTHILTNFTRQGDIHWPGVDALQYVTRRVKKDMMSANTVLRYRPVKLVKFKENIRNKYAS